MAALIAHGGEQCAHKIGSATARQGRAPPRYSIYMSTRTRALTRRPASAASEKRDFCCAHLASLVAVCSQSRARRSRSPKTSVFLASSLVGSQTWPSSRSVRVRARKSAANRAVSRTQRAPNFDLKMSRTQIRLLLLIRVDDKFAVSRAASFFVRAAQHSSPPPLARLLVRTGGFFVIFWQLQLASARQK